MIHSANDSMLPPILSFCHLIHSSSWWACFVGFVGQMIYGSNKMLIKKKKNLPLRSTFDFKVKN